MKAMVLRHIVSLDECDAPLDFNDVPVPVPLRGEVLIRISACGVCYTELDEIEGRTAPPVLPIIPGHEVVGTIESLRRGVTRHQRRNRVDVGWIHSSDGSLNENLCSSFRATGRDVNGGYPEFVAVPEDYAYPIPDVFSDQQAAPLLCAGAIGYRAFRLTNLSNGDRLGLTGFGGSAHLLLQFVRYLYPDSDVYVFARDAESIQFALDLGAVWAGDTVDMAPERLTAIIDTTPAWKPVVHAMSNLKPGGRLVINAIRKEDADKSELLQLSYRLHLWMEREM